MKKVIIFKIAIKKTFHKVEIIYMNKFLLENMNNIFTMKIT